MPSFPLGLNVVAWKKQPAAVCHEARQERLVRRPKIGKGNRSAIGAVADPELLARSGVREDTTLLPPIAAMDAKLATPSPLPALMSFVRCVPAAVPSLTQSSRRGRRHWR